MQENIIHFEAKDQFDVVICNCEEPPFQAKVIGLKHIFSNRLHHLCIELIVLSKDNQLSYHNPYDVVDKIII
jgi:hypothetical protein